MSTASRPRNRDDFKIAIICALTLEADAVMEVFDDFWDDDENDGYGKAPGDPNAYTTGVIGKHNVVLAHMPGIGKVDAATVAGGLRSSFPCIGLALVVGICGAVPSYSHDRKIHLGDIIISRSLIQYDFGRRYPKLFERKDTLEDNLGRAPTEIRAILNQLETHHHRRQIQHSTYSILLDLQGKIETMSFPGIDADKLFDPGYLHQHPQAEPCACYGEDGMEVCSLAAETACNKLGCDEGKLVRCREPVIIESEKGPDLRNPPSIHIGRMGCGDTVVKSGTHRDMIAKQDDVIAFEMEGAGVWDSFPSLVIKGVCDYADSHKSKRWQNYAAATAAACTKVFLNRWTSTREQRDIS
jgi:nucleoside phosphorylase